MADPNEGLDKAVAEGIARALHTILQAIADRYTYDPTATWSGAEVARFLREQAVSAEDFIRARHGLGERREEPDRPE